MIKLPHCHFPTAAEVQAHGLQLLPHELPILDLTRAQPYRSATCNAISIESFSHAQVLALIRVIAKSFVLNEPMNRHMVPYVNPPQIIQESTYQNLYGENIFGEWKKENIFQWVIRLLV